MTKVSNIPLSDIDVATTTGGASPTVTGSVYQLMGTGLVPEAYTSIELGYTGSNLTSVVYKLSGTTVATLTLAYIGSQLDSVTRS